MKYITFQCKMYTCGVDERKMKNINLLLDSNKTSSQRIKVRKGTVIVQIKDELFTGNTVKKIAEKINAIHAQYGKQKITIEFHLGNIEFIDKLTFVIFECICYDLVHNYGHPVQVFMKVNVKGDIHTAGIKSSPLLLLSGTSKKSILKYPDKFKRDLYGSHFRRLVCDDEKAETNFLGRLYEEIDSFLKPFNVETTSRDAIANVITELVGNGCEHGAGDCLLDIDVAQNYHKLVENISDGNEYYGINIAVVNFSDILLGDGIYNNVLKSENANLSERYMTVVKAYQNHRQLFNQDYTIKDFCNITTFQHRISGRPEVHTGGTGLTKLIQSLEERSDAYRCYVVSGDRSINFLKEMLEYDQQKWIGFNKERDYINNPPGVDKYNNGVVSETLMYMPGTAYNLNFVMKVESDDDE